MTFLSHCRSSRIGLSVGAAYLTVGKWFQGEEAAGETWSLLRCNSCLIPQVPSPHPIKAHTNLFLHQTPQFHCLCASKHSPICWKSDSCLSGTSVSLCGINTKRNLTNQQYMSRFPRHLFVVTLGLPLPHTSSPLFISFPGPLRTLPWGMANEILSPLAFSDQW